MERLNRYSKIFSSIGVALGVVLSSYAKNLPSEYSLPAWFTVLLSLIIISVSYIFFREIFHNVFLRYRIFRKWLLGDQFVEGSWLNAVYYEDTLIHIAIVSIEPDDTSIRISIELYSTKGEPIGRVNSKMVSAQWPDLSYMYKFVRPGSENKPGNGYAELQFMTNENGPPVRYNGFYIDSLEGHRCDFYGRKLTEKEEIELLKSPKGRSKLAKKEVEHQKDVRPNLQIGT